MNHDCPMCGEEGPHMKAFDPTRTTEVIPSAEQCSECMTVFRGEVILG